MKTILQIIREITATGILDAIGDGLSIQDRDYRVLFQNKKAVEIIGNHVGEFCYRAFEHKENICDGCSLEKSFRDGMIHREIRSNPTKDGQLIVEITSSVLRNKKGDIVAGMEVVRDVTRQVHLEEESNRLICDLTEALDKVKTLSGLLPICYSCKKIRDDKGYWQQVDDYIREHTFAQFSHGLCPDCVKKVFPDNFEKKK